MFSPFSSTEPSAEEWGPSTSQVGDPQPEAPHSFCCHRSCSNTIPSRPKTGDGCPKAAENSTPSTGGVLQTKN